MCCLDPMGFAVSQAFTVPFLVLLKAIDDVAADPSESRQRILKLVTESCVNLVEFNEPLRKQIIEQANSFNEPVGRTADVVPSIHILTAQLLCLLMCPTEKQ